MVIYAVLADNIFKRSVIMVTTALSYAVIAILLLSALLGGLSGLRRKFKMTLGKTLSLVLAFLGALILTKLICTGDIGIADKLSSLVEDGGANEIIAFESFNTALSYYGAMFLAPFVFLVIFLVLKLILSIVAKIVFKILPLFKGMNGLADRLIGVGLGIINGVIIAIVVLMPFVGTVKTLDTVVRRVDELSTESEDEGTNEILEFTDAISNHGGGKVVLTLGGQAMYDLTTSVKYEGERLVLADEMTNLFDIANCVVLLTDDVENYGNAQVEAFHKSADDLAKSKLLANLASDIISTASEKWLNNEEFMGISSINAGEMMDPTINSVLKVFSTSTADNISSDFHTVGNVFKVLAENDVFKNTGNSEEMLSLLGKKGVVSGVVDAIDANERMVPIGDEIRALSVRSLASVLGIPEGEDEEYNALMGNIADVMNNASEAEKHETVKAGVVDALSNYGVEVEGEAADEITNSLITDLGDKENVTDEDVKEFFAFYAMENSDKFEQQIQ